MEMAPSVTSEPVKSIADQNDRLRGFALATVLIAIMSTLLLSALDQTIVGTALPHIIADLHGFDRYTWVATAYLLTSTTMTPIVGKLSDQFGRKWFLIVGVIIFLAGSALSGASQTMNQLILFRGFQGIGAGVMMALVFTLVGDIFAPAERARWQGLFSAVFGLASVIGPFLGGYISDNFSWRWVFYVNLPLGILALIMLLIWLPSNISARTAARNIDFGGALTAAGATVCLLLGLTWGGQTYPWNSPQVIGTLVASGVLYIAFIIIERLVPEPILSLNLFRSQVFASGALLALLSGVALFATVFYLPLYVQGVLGQAATNSGVITTPLVLTLAIGAAIVGQIIARIGRYQIIAIIGAVIMVGGNYLLTLMGTATSTLEVTRNMVVLGLGIGMVFPVLTLATQNAIPRNMLGTGTATITYLRSLGATLGVAVIGTVVNNTLVSELPKHLPAGASQLPSTVLASATNQQVLVSASTRASITAQVVQGAVSQATANVPAGPLYNSIAASVTQQTTTLMQGIFEAARQSFATGLQYGFYVAFGIAVLSLIVTFFLKDIPLAQRASAGSPVTEAIDLEELTGPVPVVVQNYSTAANGRLPELGRIHPGPDKSTNCRQMTRVACRFPMSYSRHACNQMAALLPARLTG